MSRYFGVVGVIDTAGLTKQYPRVTALDRLDVSVGDGVTGLVGAKPEVARTLGIELNPEHETLAIAEIFTDLRMEQTIHPLRPLLDGTWE